jgi:Flp pilus assembly protein TadG
MIFRPGKPIRKGSVLVEAALVYPILALFLIGTISLGLGVCAFQTVSAAAREGARYASVHGGQYASVTGNAMATQGTVYTNGIQPHLAGVDTSQVTYTVTWANSGEMPTYKDGTGKTVTNYVTVTVNYQWHPAAYLTGPINISSTSVMPMSF